MSAELWTLTFAPEAGHAEPMAVRVRRLLKCSLRQFGLRLVSLAPPDTQVQELRAQVEALTAELRRRRKPSSTEDGKDDLRGGG